LKAGIWMSDLFNFKKKKNCRSKNKGKNDGCLDIIVTLVLIIGAIVIACMIAAALFRALGIFIVAACLIGFFVLLFRCK